MGNGDANGDDVSRRDFLDTAAKASLVGVGAMPVKGGIPPSGKGGGGELPSCPRGGASERSWAGGGGRRR